MNPSPTMYLIYIDESYDITHFAYAALLIRAFEWNNLFETVRIWRRGWFDRHTIALDYELHATNFVGGRGEPHDNRNKKFRAELFAEVFDMVNTLKETIVVSGITPDKKGHLNLFETLLFKVQSILLKENAYAVLICDEGNEATLTSLVRKLKKEGTKIDRILEDPLFKTSKSSYFLQLADFIAFGVLRSTKQSSSTRKEVASAVHKIKKQVSVYSGLSSEPPASLNYSK